MKIRCGYGIDFTTTNSTRTFRCVLFRHPKSIAHLFRMTKAPRLEETHR